MLSIGWRKSSGRRRRIKRNPHFIEETLFFSRSSTSETLMLELLKTVSSWLTTSGIKIIGILITFIILSQMSKWIVKWLERFIREKDPLQAVEAKKRAQTLGKILRHAFLTVIAFTAVLMILGELGI